MIPAPLEIRAAGQLLDRLASRLTPSFEEDAVFAYQEPSADHSKEVVTESKPEEPEEMVYPAKPFCFLARAM